MQENTFEVTSGCNAYYIKHLASGAVACLGDGVDRMDALDFAAQEYLDTVLTPEARQLLQDIEVIAPISDDEVAAEWTVEANECAGFYYDAYFRDREVSD